MLEKFVDGVQKATKVAVTVSATLGTFGLELVLLEKAGSTRGGAALTTALAKAGRLVGLPSMTGGLTVMVGSSVFVGYEAGEAVDKLFNHLRRKDGENLIPAEAVVV